MVLTEFIMIYFLKNKANWKWVIKQTSGKLGNLLIRTGEKCRNNEEGEIPGSAYCHRFGEEAGFIDITLEAGGGEIGE